MLIRNIYAGPATRLNLQVSQNGLVKLISDTEASAASSTAIDAGDNYLLLPGLLDAHIHGYGGHDFCDGTIEAVANITRQLGEMGVAYCAATLVSLELKRLKATLAILDEYIQQQNDGLYRGHTKITAVHLEGPFISHACKGAHDEQVLQPKISLELFKEIISSAPGIHEWKITLAPDLEDAIPFIRDVQQLEINGRKISVKVFLGHSNAHPDLVESAIKAGAIGYTHLGNANDEKIHRSNDKITVADVKSNVVKAAVTTAPGIVELIIDGQHISEAYVKFIISQLGNKVMPVTDALSPAGKADGTYKLGSLEVIKTGEKIVLKSDPGRLAGSVATLPLVLKNYHNILRSMDKSPAEIAEAMYYAAVTNPRTSTLSEQAMLALPDESNFVLMDNKTGEVVLHVRDGLVKQVKPLSNSSLPELLFSKTVNQRIAAPILTQPLDINSSQKLT